MSTANRNELTSLVRMLKYCGDPRCNPEDGLPEELKELACIAARLNLCMDALHRGTKEPLKGSIKDIAGLMNELEAQILWLEHKYS